MVANEKRMIQLPVDGGEYTAGVWGSGEPAVLAIHGITASHVSWRMVAERTGGTVVAPDLRGRGASCGLPGPYGMARHAADCIAVLDHLGIERPIVAGHSMGGFVAVVLAHQYPDRVARLVLIDGGVPLPIPEGVSTDQALAATVGPALQRLEMTFPTREAYRDWWRQHPAMAEWNDAITEYVDYDLTGEPPELRSRTSTDAVRGDSADLFTGDDLAKAYAALAVDVQFLRAERGMLDQPTPLYPDRAAIAERMPVHDIAGTNHYTLLLGEPGAAAVAERLG